MVSLRVPFTGGKRLTFGRPAVADDFIEIGGSGAVTGGRGGSAPLLNGQLGEDDYSPDWGVDKRYALIDKMRLSDDDLGAVLGAIGLPIRRATFAVKPGAAEDKAIADFAWSDLTHLRGMTWSDFIRQCLLAPTFGNMAFEKVWRLGEDGKAHIHALAPRMPATFTRYDVDTHGSLTSVQQQATGGSTPSGLVTLRRDKLLLIVNDQEGANYRGRSILRGPYRSWFMQANLEQLSAIAAERRSVGVDEIVMSKTVTPARQAQAERAVRLLHSGEKGFFAHGEDLTYNIRGSDGSIIDPLVHIEYFRKKKITGLGAAMLLLGQGGTGSYALSKDKSDLFMLGIEAIADMIVDAINADVLVPLFEWNFGTRGADRPWPKLAYQKLDTRAAVDVITALSAATGAGLITPTLETENEVRRLAEIDAIDPAAREASARTFAPGFGPGQPTRAPVAPVPAMPPASATVDATRRGWDAARAREKAAGPTPAPATNLGSASGRSPGLAGGPGTPMGPGGMRHQPAPGSLSHAHLARRAPGERWKPLRAAKGPEVYCDFQAMADALDDTGEAIVQAASGELADAAAQVIAEGERVFASGKLLDLLKIGTPDAATLASTLATQQRGLYDVGRREVRKETAAQVQQGATPDDLKPEDGVRPLAVSLARAQAIRFALDTEIDAGDLAKIDATFAVKGRTVAESLIQRVRRALIDRMLQQAQRGSFDAADLQEYHQSLSDKALRQDAKILTTTALGLGRQAEHDTLVGQATSSYYSTMLDEQVCCVCEAYEERVIEPGGDEYYALYPPRAGGSLNPCCDEPKGLAHYTPQPAGQELSPPDCCGEDRCRCDIILVFNEAAAQV